MFLISYTKHIRGLADNPICSSIDTWTSTTPEHTISLAFRASTSDFVKRPDFCAEFPWLSGLI